MTSNTGGADTHIVEDQPHAKLFTVSRQELLSRYTNGTGTRKNKRRPNMAVLRDIALAQQRLDNFAKANPR